MIDLSLSILCSSLIFVIFKYFDVFKIQTPYAIVANYLVACLVGFFFYERLPSITAISSTPWFIPTLLLGMLFILVFNIMARSSQQNGVGTTSVATKMSLVIPVALGVFLYNEQLSLFQVFGIALALVAVYFASIKQKSLLIKKDSLLLPLLVFLGSGIVDSSIKYIQQTKLTTEEFPLFSSTVFAAAAATGLLFIFIRSIKNPLKISFKNIMGGIALGVPNYFSIFFLLRALQSETLNSASVFTINNVAIVMFSTLLGILLFKERLSMKNWLGIGMAIISILLVALF